MVRLNWLARRAAMAVFSVGLATACGETFTTKSEATGGTDGGGGSSGGAHSGGSASGGDVGTGGSGASMCSSHSNCLAVVDTTGPCFSPHCASPQAATVLEVANDPCLLLWENRFDEPPDGCRPEPSDVACPADCAQPPECVWARCQGSSCAIHAGYTEEECMPSGDCTQLTAELDAAVAEAQACTPSPLNDNTSSRVCTSHPGVQDSCGCLVVVNEESENEIRAAQAAFEAWSDAQCSPVPECGDCRDSSGGECVAQGATLLTGRCEPTPK